MAKFDIVMPKLGESVIEATITRWLKNVGDSITEDEPIVEIATDKVDAEIPSPVAGVIKKIFFSENQVVAVGEIIAVVDMDSNAFDQEEEMPASTTPVKTDTATLQLSQPEFPISEAGTTRFYSPLVKNIASKENIGIAELEAIPGTGKDGRLTKNDLTDYLKIRTAPATGISATSNQIPASSSAKPATAEKPVSGSKFHLLPGTAMQGDEIIEMDRMRRLIADHMVASVHTSPHVTSFIEVDVTNMARWRDRVKDDFLKRVGEKITFTPIFVEAAAQALKEYPNVNASVDGYNIIRRKNIHIGMAAALPNGNLIVPVIKNADQKNLLGLARDVNRLANNARTNKLEPDDISGGTFTITNLGTFGSITGTPIINQPQVAILGIGVIKKKAVVMETDAGDVIAIRHMMILSLSYDHRVVDGALGGMFIRRMAELLEKFDINRSI